MRRRANTQSSEQSRRYSNRAIGGLLVLGGIYIVMKDVLVKDLFLSDYGPFDVPLLLLGLMLTILGLTELTHLRGYKRDVALMLAAVCIGFSMALLNVRG